MALELIKDKDKESFSECVYKYFSDGENLGKVHTDIRIYR